MNDWLILAPALVAGFLVLLTHVPLGRVVLSRGIIFIDLAVAQIAGLGVIAAHALGWDSWGVKTQLLALLSAIAGAFLLGKAEKLFQQRQEALIGISFVLAATAGVLLLANNPVGGDYLRELLIGQILWTTWQALIPLAVASVLFLLLYWHVPNCVSGHYFYLLFAVIITFSVQIVGVYLVFASLVVPAFSVFGQRQKALLSAYLIGALGYLSGLLVSVHYDWPTGAAIVWCLAVLATVYLLISGGWRSKNV